MKKIITMLSLTALTANVLAQNDSTITKIPFDGMNLTWINGQNRQREFPLTFKKMMKW